MEEVRLHFAGNQNFSCTACGKCCREPWTVPVSAAKFDSLSQTQSYQNYKRAGYEPLPLAQGSYQIGRDPEGLCYFQQDDGGCEIHAEHGLDAKPHICQIYPYEFVKTPDGLFVSLAFSCPAVLAGVGESISREDEYLRSLLTDYPHDLPEVMGRDDEVLVSEGYHITWAEYSKLEIQLLSCLDPKDPVLSLLGAACHLAGQVRSGEPLTLAGALTTEMNALLTEICEVYPFFCGNAIGLMEKKSEGADFENFLSSLLEGGDLAFSKRLQSKLPTFERKKPENDILKEVLARFVANFILGKRLLSGLTLISNSLLLATSIGVLLYYFELKSKRSGSLHFSFEDLEWAFDLIEGDLVTHNQGFKPAMLQYERALGSYAGVFFPGPG